MAEQETPAPDQAPLSRLDGEPPPTSLDGAAPPTSLDRQPPPTSLDVAPSPGEPPPTVLDSSADADTVVRLPPSLREDYEPLRELPSGGEGFLILTRHRPTDELRVVKIYHVERPRDQRALEILAKADPAHVVVIHDFDQHAGHWWEAMEYCEHGSLVELIRNEGPKLPPERIREVIEEVAGALSHLHSLKIPHCDLKPANIMVRTLDPLDLALADFGLIRLLELSREMHSRLAISTAYASPQTQSSGAVSPAMDWWSLGIILAEAAQGRNPFQQENGEWLPDRVVKDWISSRPIDLSGIEDERLRNLCRGLTTRDDRKGQRWGVEEVRAWLRGEDPKIAPEPESATITSPKSASPFPFKDPATGRTRPFTDPRELSRALALDWEAALALLSGTAAHRAEQRALRNFLRSLDLSEAEQILTEQDDAEERLVRLLIELDPETKPTFRGYSVDKDGLLSLAQAEGESQSAALAALYSERILLDCSRASGQARLAEVDAAWHEEVARFEQTIDQARSEQDQPLLSDQREREAHLLSVKEVVSPLQGTVLKVAVEQGASIEEGDLICVIEAMKVENEITAHRPGKVTTLNVSEGAGVSGGDVLAVIEDPRSNQGTSLLADQREREDAIATARPQILAALLDDDLRQQTLTRGAEAAHDESPRRAGWFTVLAGLTGQEDSLGWAVALAALRPLAVRLADEREREEGEAERQRAEQEVVERERAEREDRIASGHATPADLEEIAQKAFSQLNLQDRVAIGEVWTRLVATSALGPPTHDVLEVHVEGRNSQLVLTELSRSAAWLAPDIAEYSQGGESRRIWLDSNGSVWHPCYGHGKPYGSSLERTYSRLWFSGQPDLRFGKTPHSLMIVLPTGLALNTRKYWGRTDRGSYGRCIDVIDGFCVAMCDRDLRDWGHETDGADVDRRKVILSILRARGFSPSTGSVNFQESPKND